MATVMRNMHAKNIDDYISKHMQCCIGFGLSLTFRIQFLLKELHFGFVHRPIRECFCFDLSSVFLFAKDSIFSLHVHFITMLHLLLYHFRAW